MYNVVIVPCLISVESIWEVSRINQPSHSSPLLKQTLSRFFLHDIVKAKVNRPIFDFPYMINKKISINQFSVIMPLDSDMINLVLH
jgi:hypothetical protein